MGNCNHTFMQWLSQAGINIGNCTEDTSPILIIEVSETELFLIFAFIFSSTSNRPILVEFSPTFSIKTLDFLEINALTIKKAAEEKSPTTSYEEILDRFDL